MNATRILTVMLGAVLLLGGACKNSKYCDDGSNSCPAAMTCNLMTHACMSGSGGAGGAGGETDGGAGSGGKTDGGSGGGGSGGHPFRCDASAQCSERNDGAAPVCELDAASCVGCVVDMDCTEDSTKPICGGGHTCGQCVMGTTNQCAGHSGKTVCSRSGSCVECVTSNDCTADKTRPICGSTNQCQPCVADSECVSKGATDPGVCMSQTDGHCATPAETIYVQNTMTGTTICSDTAVGAGTISQPFCTMQPVPAALTTTLDLVVVRGTVSAGTSVFMGQGAPATSIVGQQSAFIASAASPGLAMQSGSIYIRGITFSPSASIGISATGGMLRLDTVTIDSCKGGGIFLDHTAFEIDNTKVTNNGPGQQGATSWGGILVNSLPASGLTKLDLVTIQANKPVGLTCSNGISGVGVLASGNTGGVDVSPTCGVNDCITASPTCGAQP
jgi:hypothetical protein